MGGDRKEEGENHQGVRECRGVWVGGGGPGSQSGGERSGVQACVWSG